MARPHIEFIHAQDLEWQTDVLPEPFADVEMVACTGHQHEARAVIPL